MKDPDSRLALFLAEGEEQQLEFEPALSRHDYRRREHVEDEARSAHTNLRHR